MQLYPELALPGTNASSERVFSLMNAVWSDERNQYSVQTVKAKLITKCYFKDIFCMDFYSFLKERPTLLQDIQSSKKYDTQETMDAPNPGSC